MPRPGPGAGTPAGQCTGADGTIGTKYSFAQLEGLWINAGGSRVTAPVAAAVGLAESGGCSAAVNPTDNNGTQTSWGIWQISDGTHNQPPGILEPAENALAAVTKYQQAGNSFRPWGTFTSGAYKGFMGNATPDLSVPGSTTIGGATGTDPGAGDPDCIQWAKIPGVSALGITAWPGVCFLHYKQARELIGAAVLVGGALVMGWGAELLVGMAALGVASKVITPAVSKVSAAQGTVRKVQQLTGRGRKPAAPKRGRKPAAPKRPAARRPAQQRQPRTRQPGSRQTYPIRPSRPPATTAPRRRPVAAGGARPAQPATTPPTRRQRGP